MGILGLVFVTKQRRYTATNRYWYSRFYCLGAATMGVASEGHYSLDFVYVLKNLAF